MDSVQAGEKSVPDLKPPPTGLGLPPVANTFLSNVGKKIAAETSAGTTSRR